MIDPSRKVTWRIRAIYQLMDSALSIEAVSAEEPITLSDFLT